MAAQLPDKILVDGEQRELYSNPLELFWTSTKKTRPRFITTTECSRGYIAAWEIRNNNLLLKEINATYDRNYIFFKKKASYSLRNLFPKSKDRPVKAAWFSGKIRVPIGKMSMYVHSGYDSRFEKELILTIQEGEVIKVVTLDMKEKSLVINLEQ